MSEQRKSDLDWFLAVWSSFFGSCHNRQPVAVAVCPNWAKKLDWTGLLNTKIKGVSKIVNPYVRSFLKWVPLAWNPWFLSPQSLVYFFFASLFFCSQRHCSASFLLPTFCFFFFASFFLASFFHASFFSSSFLSHETIPFIPIPAMKTCICN